MSLTPRIVLHGLRAYARRRLVRSRLDPTLREAIVLHVSAVNECPVCSSIHERLAMRLGLSADEIFRARIGDARDQREAIALRYAEAKTLGRHDEASARALTAAFDPGERREIDALVDLFTFNNAFNNAWEGRLPGAARRRARLRRP